LQEIGEKRGKRVFAHLPIITGELVCLEGFTVAFPGFGNPLKRDEVKPFPVAAAANSIFIQVSFGDELSSLDKGIDELLRDAVPVSVF
jgi:hypothetical protein